MSYSLLDRFRGAWLGAAIGQQLCDRHSSQNLKDRTWLSDNLPRSWLEWTIKEIALTLQEPKSADFPWEQNSQIDFKASTIILWLLPVILYHHDFWFGLSSFLVRSKGRHDSVAIDNVLVWCYTIRLALRGELFPQGLTQRVVLGTQLKQTASIEWLEKVELSCLKGWAATQLIAELSPMRNREIPLALFCFLNNPQDFWLTTQQALSLERQAANVTALSTALSGAYNGVTSIPTDWRISFQHSSNFYREIMVKTEQMIREWLGIDRSVNSKTLPSVIMAPKVLQSRSSLRIISQKEYT